MHQLLEELPQNNSVSSLRNRLLISVMVLQGCRTVEMHRVNVGDIVQDGSNVGLTVWAKRSIRVVPLTPNLAKLLQQYLDARRKAGEILADDTPLFISVAHTTRGFRLSRRSIRRVVDKYLSAIGLKELPPTQRKTPKLGGKKSNAQQIDHREQKTPHKSQRKLSAHSLRHTAGTLALRAGACLRQVQDLLGHADPRTTVVYAHIGDRWSHNPALLLSVNKPKFRVDLIKRLERLQQSLKRINPLELTLNESETLSVLEAICA